METPETIKMRGHHLKPLAYIFLKTHTKPESDAQVQWSYLENLLTIPHQKIELIENQPDGLCGMCDNQAGCYNVKLSEIARDSDKIMAYLLKLEIGKTYTIKELTDVFERERDLFEIFASDCFAQLLLVESAHDKIKEQESLNSVNSGV